jgi:hypothetical protein
MNINNSSCSVSQAKTSEKNSKDFTVIIVYVVINSMIVILNVQDLKSGESYFKYEKFFTQVLGIGFSSLMDFRYLFQQ